jgi:pimeloyl-ACP methyl ester carboxylesterase
LDLSYEGYRDKTFIKLLAYLKSGDRLGLLQRYKIYALRYPTFENVLQSSQFLKEQLASLASKGAKPPVLLGHSMGGLVARGLLTLPGAPPIRGILTLGTPHEGTPFGAVSNGTSSIPEKRWIDAAAACRTPKWALSLFVNDFPPSNGTADLDPAGAFISFLKGNRIGQDRIFSFAGQLTAGDLIDHPIYARLACMLGYLDNTLASDGVVPVASAAPGWTALQAILQHHTHEGMHDGRPGDELFTRIGDVLDRLSRCEATTPTPPGRNDIILSGSVARINARQVDVTLNAIIVDGVVQRNLTKSNFQIIENGCSLDSGTFEITTGTGSVGVDLVFAQDLSGSMGSAISGVRTSVISFAQSLASRGLSVQFGSIGYSGPGRIPTTPPTSSCEFLGPFEQLTSAAAFQAHVQSSWLLGSGCDFPENGLEAIEYAHQHVDWRPGAARVYIDITDASHHTTTTDCNLAGPCTDETLTSITTLLGGTSVIHAVASADVFDRTGDGGLDPWLLANATGGQRLVLPDNGIVDLNALTIADVIGQTVRLTFTSASAATAPLNLRVRVTINGKVGEFSPGLLTYAPIHVSLSR